MTSDAFLSGLPLQLNTQQLQAVQTINGPVLLLAVPGSGKTTVLVARLGYMISCMGIDPANILTLTYTVAATNDMRARFGKLFGEELGAKLAFKTINSICSSIILYYGRLTGQEPFALENDEKILLSIISALYQKYEDEYPAESDLKGIKTLITYIKNMMLTEEEIIRLGKENGIQLNDIYRDYCSELRARKRMDFDDQMVYAYRLLKSRPQLLEAYQNRYPYICVDEAQDTSKIQHEIIALLASKTENLFMVGDEDQSIYGFRAAYPEALLEFEKNHKNAKILLMEENFRSNANIVKAADRFIQTNTLRHEKHMKATKEVGSEVKEIALKSRSAQYTYLLKVARDCAEQTAVLYRDNESMLPLVDLLEREGIPYSVRNAELSFFTNRVVADIQNILRFSMDMKNADLFQQIYYKLNTYLNKKAALEACDYSREYGITVFEAINRFIDVQPHIRTKLRTLQKHFESLKNADPKSAFFTILKQMDYGEYMEKHQLSDSKIFIMKAIAGRETTIEGFLERMENLKEIIRTGKRSTDCPFILSTIHGSKGLEYDNVYLMDVLDGIFPESIPENPKRADKEEIEAYEEARRLFYVGVTRAKNNLYLFRTHEPSTFIKQLLPPAKKAEKAKPDSTNHRISEISHSTVSEKPAGRKVSLRENSLPITNTSYPDAEYMAFVHQLKEGTAICHKKYGKGILVELNEPKATIVFEGQEPKVFNLRFLFRNGLVRLL